MLRESQIIKEKWLYAAVAGSLWASLEIIAGSFLHNLRFPFAGTVLAMFGVVLMTACQHYWKVGGIIWRAGLICAIMKSISPSAVIFGPMAGIFAEALLMQLSVTIFGKNLIAYIIGGMLALLSVLAHKIISLLIIYGSDIVSLAENLCVYASSLMNIHGNACLMPFIILTVLFMTAGVVSAVIGYFVSLRATASINTGSFQNAENMKDVRQFEAESPQNRSLWLLLLNIAAVTAGLVLAATTDLAVFSVFTLIFVLHCILNYGRALKKLQKPMFWIHLFVITMLAALFWKGISVHQFFSAEGIQAGLKMNVRALLVIIGFTAIGTELGNPRIKDFCFRKSNGNLFHSLEIAFMSLPVIVAGMPPVKSFLKTPLTAFSSFLSISGRLLVSIEKRESAKKIVMITGKQGSGKTTFIKKLTEHLILEHCSVSGVIAKVQYINGVRSAYEVEDIKTGRRAVLCKSKTNADGRMCCGFNFNDEVFESFTALIKSQLESHPLYTILDEAGPLEMSGKGWANLLQCFINQSASITVLVIRTSIAEQFVKLHPEQNYIFVNENDFNSRPDKVIKRIINLSLLNNG